MGEQVRKQKRSSIIAGGFFRFAVYLIVAAVVIYIGKTAYDFGYNIFYQQPMDSEEEGRDVTVAVEEGDSVYQIGRTLESRGLIQDAKVFVVQEKLSNYSGKLQPGTYILNTNTHKFHLPECSGAADIKAKNRQEYTGSREDLTSQGYEPCGRCQP